MSAGDEQVISTADEFLALYHRDVDGADTEWRTRAVGEEACRELLKQGFRAETLLLNKRLPISVLRTLAADQDPRIRCMIADKRSAAALLGELANDPEVSVRLRVAWSAKAPRALLEVLSNDAALEVRDAARSRLLALNPRASGRRGLRGIEG